MHIAICFFGLTRSLKFTIDSIEKNIFNVLSSNNIEFTKFIHTYNLNQLTNHRSKEYNCKLDIHEYKLLHCNYEIITDQDEFLKTIDFDKYKKNGDPWNDNFKSLKNLLCQLNSLNLVTGLWKNTNKKFDLIMYVRPDLQYNQLCINDLLTSLNEQCVLTPSFHMFGGLNDRIAIGPPEYMHIYGSRLLFADSYSTTKKLHSETFLKYIVTSNNFKHSPTFKLMGKRVRANGMIVDCELF